MKQCLILLCTLFFYSNMLLGQSVGEFNRGVYKDFESFNARKPTNDTLFSAMKIETTEYYKLKYFNGKRVSKSFALSDGKRLYINTRGISDKLANDYWVIFNEGKRVYAEALKINNKVIYLEREEVGKSIVFVGVALVNDRGVVYEHSLKKFTVLKRNIDVFNFLNRVRPELIQKYNNEKSNKKIDIEIVRSIIEDVF